MTFLTSVHFTSTVRKCFSSFSQPSFIFHSHLYPWWVCNFISSIFSNSTDFFSTIQININTKYRVIACFISIFHNDENRKVKKKPATLYISRESHSWFSCFFFCFFTYAVKRASCWAVVSLKCFFLKRTMTREIFKIETCSEDLFCCYNF